MGFKKSYVINKVGQAKILCVLTMWVGGSKKGPKYAYVIYEWSLDQMDRTHVLIACNLKSYINSKEKKRNSTYFLYTAPHSDVSCA